MIHVGSFLKITDNTGAQIGQCLKILNKPKKQVGHIGDIILVAIKQVKNKNKTKKIYKKELHKAIIVRTKKKILRYDGSSLKFNTNSIVLLKKELQKNLYLPIGSRIFGPISNDLRIQKERFFKIISISSKNL